MRRGATGKIVFPIIVHGGGAIGGHSGRALDCWESEAGVVPVHKSSVADTKRVGEGGDELLCER